MTKQATFESAVANHVRKQIAIGAEQLGGINEVVNNCVLVPYEGYSSKDAWRQFLAHERFEKNFESEVSSISIHDVRLDGQMQPTFVVEVWPKQWQSKNFSISSIQMSVGNDDFSTDCIWSEPEHIDANDPNWDIFTDLFMGESTLRVAEF